jgi:pimeloyl-ACP methyl ester carboxylesterase
MNKLSMKIVAVLAGCLLFLSVPAFARVEPFPASFKVMDREANGATIHVRIGGSGPAVLMLHGFGDTGDMWAPLAAVMMKDHTVVVPDLRGMGLSSHPETGYEKKTQALDMLGVLDELKIGKIDLVTHDIGNMVGFSLAAQAPQRVKRWVVMDAPLPGIGHWTEQLLSPKTWHFSFYGPDEERLVAGRERIYLDRFYNELSADPAHVDEETREHYAALYARPQAMHSAFAQFAAFRQDAIDNPALLGGRKLSLPVLAIGGEKSYGTHLATEIGFAAANVTALSIPNAGHWLMEEQPDKTIAAITGFLARE